MLQSLFDCNSIHNRVRRLCAAASLTRYKLYDVSKRKEIMKTKIFLAINIVLASAIFVGDYLFLTVGGSNLKALCSSGFAIMGAANLIYALISRISNMRYAVSLSVGLVFACLGDIIIDRNFVIGAALFAIGHICYFVSYCTLYRIRKADLIISGAIFVAAGIFVLFCPLLDFPNAVMQIVCLVYALIISLMVGKAISNFVKERTVLTATVLVGSILFFFSDLMLVFDWFMGIGRIAALLCMSTYYPAECILAFSSWLNTKNSK